MGKIILYNCNKKVKNEKLYGNQRTFYMNFSQKRFRSGIHRLLMRTDARGNAIIIYVIGPKLQLCVYLSVIDITHRRCVKYLIRSANIILLVWHFNLVKKSNLVDRLNFNMILYHQIISKSQDYSDISARNTTRVPNNMQHRQQRFI